MIEAAILMSVGESARENQGQRSRSLQAVKTASPQPGGGFMFGLCKGQGSQYSLQSSKVKREGKTDRCLWATMKALCLSLI